MTVFAELAGLDEKALARRPERGLDGLLEMIEAWMEVNNLENFMGAARALWRRARAGRRAVAPTADRHGAEPGHRQRELMEDYYLDEIGAVAEAWNALRRPPAEDAEEAVTPEAFFGGKVSGL